jgi:hypothetical protein
MISSTYRNLQALGTLDGYKFGRKAYSVTGHAYTQFATSLG